MQRVSPARSVISKYAQELYPLCLEAETRIAGKVGDDARAWARTDAIRHAHTLHALLGVAKRSETLTILNASGLYHGHQDIALASALRRRGMHFEWVAQESCDSRYIDDPYLKEALGDLGIQVELVDYRRPLEPRGSLADAVLFTEIAEHLDHTALLNALAVQRSNLRSDGTLILTTPNLLSLPNRVRFAFGRGDQPFFGDGVANKEAGLYGHIACYDIGRLTRILGDAGITTTSAYTFDWGRAWKPGIMPRVVEAFSAMIPRAGQNIFIQGRHGESVPIPFAT